MELILFKYLMVLARIWVRLQQYGMGEGGWEGGEEVERLGYPSIEVHDHT